MGCANEVAPIRLVRDGERVCIAGEQWPAMVDVTQEFLQATSAERLRCDGEQFTLYLDNGHATYEKVSADTARSLIRCQLVDGVIDEVIHG